MPKFVNYLETCRRHYADAQLLEHEGRVPNAGHLYGVSAECGIKALLVSLGHPTDANGNMDKSAKLREHINVLYSLTAQLQIYVSGRGGGRYLAMIPSLGHFADWQVDHRYYAAAAIPASLSNWESAAREVQEMIQQALLDGVVR